MESESPKRKPTSPESESLKREPASPESESLKREPASPESESLKREPASPESESLKRKPTSPESEPLKREPASPESESLKREPASPESESLKRKPTSPESEPLKREPASPESESLKREPASPESESLKREPASPESESLKRKPTSPESEPLKREPASPESESLKREPVSPESESLKREPVSPESESLKRKPTSPESEPLKRKPTSPESESLKREPASPESESLKRKPTSPESESQKRRITVPGDCIDEVWELTKGTVDKKLEKSEPYRIFMSPISCDQRTHTEELTLSFAELLDKSLGDLTDSLHINFMVEIGWLISRYIITGQRGKRMTLVYENCDLNLNELQKHKKILYIRHKKIINKNFFGHQHSKVSMFAYADGSLRVVVMSANLCESDWTKYAQGIWVSPKFPLKDEDNKSDGNSKTNFKLDILRYLKSFSGPILIPWIKKIEKVDFSQANVFFIPSVPGKYTEPLWGHLYLKNILKKHACLPSRVSSEWPIIAQCSSLGSLGTTDEEWLKSEFIKTLSASTDCGDTDTGNNPIPFSLIYPSLNNVLNSWDGALGGICLPYIKNIHEKQLWLKNYMCLWKCSSRNRTNSTPHIKTYCRISSCCTEMSWFLLTSANLSKSAWGRKLKTDEQTNLIMAHEAGVLFLPQFLIGSDTFPINKTETNKSPYFTLPFDLPLSEYSDTDQPWTIDRPITN